MILISDHKHFLKPEQEVRNYFLALNLLEEKLAAKEAFSKELLLEVQALVEKGASKEKIGLRGAFGIGHLLFDPVMIDAGPEHLHKQLLAFLGLAGLAIHVLIIHQNTVYQIALHVADHSGFAVIEISHGVGPANDGEVSLFDLTVKEGNGKQAAQTLPLFRKQLVVVEDIVAHLGVVLSPEKVQIHLHVPEGALGKLLPHKEQHFQRIHVLIYDFHGFPDVVLQKTDAAEADQLFQVGKMLIHRCGCAAAGAGNVPYFQFLRRGGFQKLIGFLDELGFLV